MEFQLIMRMISDIELIEEAKERWEDNHKRKLVVELVVEEKVNFMIFYNNLEVSFNIPGDGQGGD